MGPIAKISRIPKQSVKMRALSGIGSIATSSKMRSNVTKTVLLSLIKSLSDSWLFMKCKFGIKYSDLSIWEFLIIKQLFLYVICWIYFKIQRLFFVFLWISSDFFSYFYDLFTVFFQLFNYVNSTVSVNVVTYVNITFTVRICNFRSKLHTHGLKPTQTPDRFSLY